MFCRYPDDFASTTIIGNRQFKKAASLFDDATEQLTGRIGYRHKHLDMSNLEVDTPNGEKVHTCPAAVGFSFAAGTTDGPGAFDFKQGDHQVSYLFIWVLVWAVGVVFPHFIVLIILPIFLGTSGKHILENSWSGS